MQLSRGFDYAIRSLVYLALVPGGKTAELKAISESQSVPISYLAKVMRNMVKNGIVASTLGRDGGYVLRRSPESITLLQIYEAIEGQMRLVECLEGDGTCAFVQGCTQASVWRRLTATVEGIFRETTLKDLLPQPIANETADDSKERKYVRAGA